MSSDSLFRVVGNRQSSESLIPEDPPLITDVASIRRLALYPIQRRASSGGSNITNSVISSENDNCSGSSSLTCLASSVSSQASTHVNVVSSSNHVVNGINNMSISNVSNNNNGNSSGGRSNCTDCDNSTNLETQQSTETNSSSSTNAPSTAAASESDTSQVNNHESQNGSVPKVSSSDDQVAGSSESNANPPAPPAEEVLPPG